MTVNARRGVRYARLADPADRTSPAVPVDGVAEEPVSVFPQVPGGLDPLIGPALSELPQSDDAFLLDVWAPDGARGLPLLVMVPGGAFISGAGTVRWYDGARLASEGMVVVSVNYRLGAPGVIGTRTEPANRGLADLVVALRWIAENAEEFGADPSALTLMGQSAGAWYAFALAQHPETAPLIRRLALLSLPWQPALPADEYERRAATFFDALDGDLATASREALLAAQAAVVGTYRGGPAFRPAIGDGVTGSVQHLATAAETIRAGEWWLNTTADEALAFLAGAPNAAFGEEAVRGFAGARFAAEDAAEHLIAETPSASWKQRLARATTLHEFELFAAAAGEAAAAAGKDVTLTRFDIGTPMLGGASPHCFELPFVFGNPEHWEDAPMLAGVPEHTFAEASAHLVALLAGLVRDGQPRLADGTVPAAVGDLSAGENGDGAGHGGEVGAARTLIGQAVTGDLAPVYWDPRY